VNPKLKHAWVVDRTYGVLRPYVGAFQVAPGDLVMLPVTHDIVAEEKVPPCEVCGAEPGFCHHGGRPIELGVATISAVPERLGRGVECPQRCYDCGAAKRCLDFGDFLPEQCGDASHQAIVNEERIDLDRKQHAAVRTGAAEEADGPIVPVMVEAVAVEGCDVSTGDGFVARGTEGLAHGTASVVGGSSPGLGVETSARGVLEDETAAGEGKP